MEDKDILEIRKHLTPVDPKDFVDFENLLKKELIPKILETVDERRANAAISRLWQLKS